MNHESQPSRRPPRTTGADVAYTGGCVLLGLLAGASAIVGLLGLLFGILSVGHMASEVHRLDAQGLLICVWGVLGMASVAIPVHFAGRAAVDRRAGRTGAVLRRLATCLIGYAPAAALLVAALTR